MSGGCTPEYLNRRLFGLTDAAAKADFQRFFEKFVAEYEAENERD